MLVFGECDTGRPGQEAGEVVLPAVVLVREAERPAGVEVAHDGPGCHACDGVVHTGGAAHHTGVTVTQRRPPASHASGHSGMQENAARAVPIAGAWPSACPARNRAFPMPGAP